MLPNTPTVKPVTPAVVNIYAIGSIKRIVFQRKGHKVRAMFDRDHLPQREQMIRNKIKQEML